MNYTYILLNNKDDCQALLAAATEQKASLEFRKLAIERHCASASLTLQETEADLYSVNTQISISESIISAIPDSEVKDRESMKLMGLEYKKALLQQRLKRYSPVRLLETELDIGLLTNNIAETQNFIAGITSRLNEV